jgi:hypothetical protein
MDTPNDDTPYLGRELYARHVRFPRTDFVGASALSRYALFTARFSPLTIARWGAVSNGWPDLPNLEWLRARQIGTHRVRGVGATSPPRQLARTSLPIMDGAKALPPVAPQASSNAPSAPRNDARVDREAPEASRGSATHPEVSSSTALATSSRYLQKQTLSQGEKLGLPAISDFGKQVQGATAMPGHSGSIVRSGQPSGVAHPATTHVGPPIYQRARAARATATHKGGDTSGAQRVSAAAAELQHAREGAQERWLGEPHLRTDSQAPKVLRETTIPAQAIRPSMPSAPQPPRVAPARSGDLVETPSPAERQSASPPGDNTKLNGKGVSSEAAFGKDHQVSDGSANEVPFSLPAAPADRLDSLARAASASALAHEAANSTSMPIIQRRPANVARNRPDGNSDSSAATSMSSLPLPNPTTLPSNSNRPYASAANDDAVPGKLTEFSPVPVEAGSQAVPLLRTFSASTGVSSAGSPGSSTYNFLRSSVSAASFRPSSYALGTATLNRHRESLMTHRGNTEGPRGHAVTLPIVQRASGYESRNASDAEADGAATSWVRSADNSRSSTADSNPAPGTMSEPVLRIQSNRTDAKEADDRVSSAAHSIQTIDGALGASGNVDWVADVSVKTSANTLQEPSLTFVQTAQGLAPKENGQGYATEGTKTSGAHTSPSPTFTFAQAERGVAQAQQHELARNLSSRVSGESSSIKRAQDEIPANASVSVGSQQPRSVLVPQAGTHSQSPATPLAVARGIGFEEPPARVQRREFTGSGTEVSEPASIMTRQVSTPMISRLNDAQQKMPMQSPIAVERASVGANPAIRFNGAQGSESARGATPTRQRPNEAGMPEQSTPGSFLPSAGPWATYRWSSAVPSSVHRAPLAPHTLSPLPMQHAVHAVLAQSSSGGSHLAADSAHASWETIRRSPSEPPPGASGSVPSFSPSPTSSQPIGAAQSSRNIDVNKLANRVYELLVRRLTSERQQRGA